MQEKAEEEKNKIITNGIFIMFVELIISTILFAVAVKIFSIKYSILIVMFNFFKCINIFITNS